MALTRIIDVLDHHGLILRRRRKVLNASQTASLLLLL